MQRRAQLSIRCLLAVLTAALACIPLAAAPAAGAAQPARALVGSAPALPRTARVLGALANSHRLQLTVALQSQNPAGLASLATEVSTPTSPLFRHYLTVSQFSQRFGATQAAIAAVTSALRAQGLSVGAPEANDLTLPVSGSAAQVEKALSVSLSQVELPNGRSAFANDQAPSLPSSTARFVQGVAGLEDVTVDQPQQTLARSRGLANNDGSGAQAASLGPKPCSAAKEKQKATNDEGGYTADQIASTYGLQGLYVQGALGAGQTVALFEQEAFQPSDIGTYQACYGTSVPVNVVNVAGGPGPFKTAEGDGEAALDIEQIVGLAPAASVIVYQGPLTNNGPVEIISTIVSEDLAKVISSSWGVCEEHTEESVINAENTLLQEAAAQGQSFFGSSGDSGSAQCSQGIPAEDISEANTQLSVINPGSQPFATGVGGTTLLNESAPPTAPTESVWNDGPKVLGGGGSGGGISRHWGMPSYQSGAPSSLNVINANSSATVCKSTSFCREVPDVSANADPKTGYIVFADLEGTDGWAVIGGTSAAAPLWGAFAAVTNSSAACRGVPIGFVNPALYALAGSAYGTNFYEVTTASFVTGAKTNDTFFEYSELSHGNLFPLESRYNMATGLGTPNGEHLAASLCALASPVFTVSVGNPGAQTSTAGHFVALQMTGSDSGGAGLSYSASGLPAGLSISPGGLISGTPSAVGTSIVTVSAGDVHANSGATQFTWAVNAPPPPPPPPPVVGSPKLSHDSLSGLSKGKPRISFTVTAGSNAPALAAIKVGLPSGLSFSKSAKSLSKGIVVTSSSGSHLKFKAKFSNGKVTITLTKSAGQLHVTISGPAVSVNASLASKVKHHKVKTLSVSVTATDAAHAATSLSFKAKPS